MLQSLKLSFGQSLVLHIYTSECGTAMLVVITGSSGIPLSIKVPASWEYYSLIVFVSIGFCLNLVLWQREIDVHMRRASLANLKCGLVRLQ
jgi:hypothetical protein